MAIAQGTHKMEIKRLEGVAIKDLLKAFNESFSDYFTPFQLSAAQLSSKMLADKIDLNLSVGVFENENLIAFILHGYASINNEKTGYNGGTGVLPEKRGAGLTKKMYQFILPWLKNHGMDKLQLEVISENIQAITSYEKVGYKVKRRLVCYKGTICIPSTTSPVTIREMPDYNWELMESFWDITPTWQNSAHVLDALKDSTISLGAYLENQLVGYIIFNPGSQRIHQIAVSRDFRQKKVGSALVRKIIETFGNTVSVINVDEASECTHAFLEEIGLQKQFEQLEMTLQFNRGHS